MNDIGRWAEGINRRYKGDQSAQAKRELQSLTPRERKILLAWLESQETSSSITPSQQTKLESKIKSLKGKAHHHKKSSFQALRINLKTLFNKNIKSDRLLEKINTYAENQEKKKPAPKKRANKKPVEPNPVVEKKQSISEKSIGNKELIEKAEMPMGPRSVSEELQSLPEELLYRIVNTACLGKSVTDSIAMMRAAWNRGTELVLDGINATLLAQWIDEHQIPLSKISFNKKDYGVLIPKLKGLDFGYFVNIDKICLKDIGPCPALQSFNAHRVSFSKSFSEELFTEYFAELNSLDLSGSFIEDSSLEELSKLKKLHSLNLSECPQITDTGIEHLQKMMNLTSLNLAGCKEIKDLGLLQKMNLTSLDLSFNLNIGLGTGSLDKLQNMKLISLNLSGCQYARGDLKYVKNMNELASLNLTSCFLTDANLRELENMTQLTSLNLTGCSAITDGGLECLKKLKLTSLSLSHCEKITDAGLAHLKDMNLTSLDLTQCYGVSDNGLEHLHDMNFTSLNFTHCWRITGAGIAKLKKEKLTFLDATRTSVSAQDIQELRNKLPSCTILKAS